MFNSLLASWLDIQCLGNITSNQPFWLHGLKGLSIFFIIIYYPVFNMFSLQSVNISTDQFCFSHALQVDLTFICFLIKLKPISGPCFQLPLYMYPSPLPNSWSWLSLKRPSSVLALQRGLLSYRLVDKHLRFLRSSM